MSRSSRQSSPSVSLFPFLAVLVCAMGALIFLLLVTTRQIREKKAETIAATPRSPEPVGKREPSGPEPMVLRIPLPLPAELEPEIEPPKPELVPPVIVVAPKESPSSPLPKRPPLLTVNPDLGSSLVATPLPKLKPQQPLPDPNEPLRGQLVEFQAHYEKGLAALRKQEELASTGQKRIEETQNKLQGLLGQIQNAENLSTEQLSHATELQLQMREIQKDKPELQSRIQQLQEDRKKASSRYQLVPYEGLTGTTRRPIYIECSKDGIHFMAEGITIGPQDLAGFIPDYNPVLAGAEVLIRYYEALNEQRSEFAKEPPPYVLLIVRPEGSIAFYKARKCLEALPQPFGYELVDQSLELAVPKADPEAKKACEQVIAQMMAEKAQLMQQAGPVRTDPTQTGYRLHRASNGKFELQQEGAEDGLGSPLPKSAWDQVDEVPPLFEKPAPRLVRNGNPRDGREPASAPPSVPLPARVGSQGSRPLPFPDELVETGPSGHPSGTFPKEVPSPSTRNEHTGPGTAPGSPPQSFNPSGQPGSAPGSVPRNFSKPEEARPVNGSPGSPSSQPGGPNSNAPPGQTFPSQNSGSPLNREPSPPPQRIWGVPHSRDGIGLEREVTVQVVGDRLWIAGQREVLINSPHEDVSLVERFGNAVDEYARTWGAPPRNFYWVPSIRFEVVPEGTPHVESLSREIKSRWALPSKSKSVADPSLFKLKEGIRP